MLPWAGAGTLAATTMAATLTTLAGVIPSLLRMTPGIAIFVLTAPAGGAMEPPARIIHETHQAEHADGNAGWFDDQYVAIDQGPILLMIAPACSGR
jgi:hypothetical protein